MSTARFIATYRCLLFIRFAVSGERYDDAQRRSDYAPRHARSARLLVYGRRAVSGAAQRVSMLPQTARKRHAASFCAAIRDASHAAAIRHPDMPRLRHAAPL